MSRWRCFFSLRALLVLCLAGTFIFLAAKVSSYVLVAAPPFGYYYDLGVNAMAASYMAHAIHSWPDVWDNLGWGSWMDVPTFLFNPSLTYFVLVPLDMLLGDVWRPVKLLQSVEELVAFAGGAYAYATLFRGRLWSVVAGLLYAMVPATALQIRGNVELGWVYALLPLALALELRVVRRFGVAGLPVCGVLAGASGFCIAAEYLLLSSLPLYALASIAALRRFSWRGAAYGALGLICLVGLGAFFVLPTIGGQHAFSDPASRVSSLAAGSELGVFSESWFALSSLLPQEFLISSLPQFNARGDLGIVFFATAALWVLAVAGAWRIVGGAGAGVRRRAFALVVALFALSLGTTLPFAEGVWGVLRLVPGFAFLRTPDRFLIVPLLFVVLGATESLAALARARRVWQRVAAVGLVGVSIALFLKFDFQEHWLTTEDSLAYREPDLAAVNAAVGRIGERTLSYAYVRDGSQFFYSGYGVPTPTVPYGWDLAGHYNADGLGGSGLLRRAGVRSVVASPNWTTDSGLLPSAAQIAGEFSGPTVVNGPGGVIVKELQSRPKISTVRASCLYGGPGLFDWAASVKPLAGLTFVRPPAPCRSRSYLDYDPRVALAAGPGVLATWSAAQVLPGAPALRDADYAFVVGRTFMTDGWYRNSVDGDDAGSPGGASQIAAPTTFQIALPAPRVRRVTLLVRLASHVMTTLTVRAGSGEPTTVPIVARPGMQWLSLPLTLGDATQGSTAVFTLGPFVSDSGPATSGWQGIALDRIVALTGALPPFEPPTRTDAVLFSVAKLTADAASARASAAAQRANGALAPSAGPPPPLLLAPASRANVFAERFGDGVREVAQDGHGTLTYRWPGATGNYILDVTGGLAGPAAQIALRSGPRSSACCTTGTLPDGSRGVRILLPVRLVTGSPVSVRLLYDRSTLGATAFVSSVRALPQSPVIGGRLHAAGYEDFTVDLSDAATAQAAAASARDVTFSDGAVSGAAGSALTYRFNAEGDARAARLNIATAGTGNLFARLDCNGHAATKIIGPGNADLSLQADHLHTCRATLSGFAPGLSVVGCRLELFDERVAALVNRAWLPRGTYRAQLLRPGTDDRPAYVSLDGRPAVTNVQVRRSGFHVFTIRDVSSSDRVVALIARSATFGTSGFTSARKRSALRWELNVAKRSTLEIGWYPDGNWRLSDVSRVGGTVSGMRCDLTNTCFFDVHPGSYRLYHRWPAPFVAGLIVTALSLLSAATSLFLVLRPRALAAGKRRRRFESAAMS